MQIIVLRKKWALILCSKQRREFILTILNSNRYSEISPVNTVVAGPVMNTRDVASSQ